MIRWRRPGTGTGVAFSSLFLALVLASGCQRKAVKAAVSVDSIGRKEVDSVLRSHFEAFQRGDIDAWSAILSPDVFFTAADPAGVFTTRDSISARMRQDLSRVAESGISLAIQPTDSRIWVTDDGQTAGATFALDYSVTYQARTFAYRLRSSYLLERDSAGWKALAVQYSQPVSYDTLFMLLVRHQIPAARPVGGQIPPAMAAIEQQFRSDIRDITAAAIMPSAAVVTPGGLITGSDQTRRELAQWLGPAGSVTAPEHGVRGGLNRRGSVGWLATNLYVPVFAGPENAVAPMRAFVVYRLQGNRWVLAQASLSVGMKDR